MRPRRGGAAALTASPVLVGAVTVLVTIVAVFLSYNANSGLPFVPTYDLKANLPNAAQLVRGFEVRIGGARVGVISDIEPKQREDGSTYAQVTMKLDKEIEPLPAGSKLRVRPRSALGLKYLEVVPGRASADAEGLPPVRRSESSRSSRRSSSTRCSTCSTRRRASARATHWTATAAGSPAAGST